jgi:hypothetical protein
MQTRIESLAMASREFAIERSGLLPGRAAPLAFVELELAGQDWTLYYARGGDGWRCTPESHATALVCAADQLAHLAGEEAPLEDVDRRVAEALVHAAASPALRRIERELARLLRAA